MRVAKGVGNEEEGKEKEGKGRERGEEEREGLERRRARQGRYSPLLLHSVIIFSFLEFI